MSACETFREVDGRSASLDYPRSDLLAQRRSRR
jgi:hypothetical protein